MLYLALLPLLAVPGVLAGLVRRDRPSGPQDLQLFMDQDTGAMPKAAPRMATVYDSRSFSVWCQPSHLNH
jgi:hypothetical protein